MNDSAARRYGRCNSGRPGSGSYNDRSTQSRGGIVAYDGDLVGGVLGGGWHGASVEESHELWQASRHIVRLIAIPSRHPYSQELLAHVGRS